MSKGIVVFAFENDIIDYVKQAYFLALRAKKYLDLPTTVIVDEDCKSKYLRSDVFDNIFYENYEYDITFRTYQDSLKYESCVQYKNKGRYSVFYSTPYDETIVLDTDFIICNDNLNQCFNQINDFLIYDKSVCINPYIDVNEFNFVNEFGPKFYWGTTFFFRKTKQTELFFELVMYLQHNWLYFKQLYQIKGETFRNDFAFSIAISMLGNDFVSSMPGKLFYSTDLDTITNINNNIIKLTINDENSKIIPIKLENISLHAMNKFSLERCIDKCLVDI